MSMLHTRRTVLATVGSALLVGACGGGSGGVAVTPLDGIGRVEHFSVTSASTGFTYPIDVYLPPGYDAGTTRLPVIYAVDGDAQFGYVTSVSSNDTRFAALKEVLQRRKSAAVLIGIGGTARRRTDFVHPGFTAYHAFLVQELAGAVDGRYRTRSDARILSGLSLGGTLVFNAFAAEAVAGFTYARFWSTEIALESDVAGLLAQESALFASVGGRSLPVNLLLAGTPQSNGFIADALYAQMRGHAYPGLDLQTASFNTSHVGTDVPAFELALAAAGL